MILYYLVDHQSKPAAQFLNQFRVLLSAVQSNFLTCVLLLLLLLSLSLSLSSDARYIGCLDPYIQGGNCSNLKICVTSNTTNYDVVKNKFREVLVEVGPSDTSSAQKYANDECNVVAGGLSEVSLVRDKVRETTGSDANFKIRSILRNTTEPLALVTRQDDPQWSDFVHWIVTATFYAEENGITRANADSMPTVSLFGSTYAKMLRQAIGAVGSYAEIYERNIGDTFNRTQTGLNLLYNPDNTSALLFAIQDLKEFRK
jgi:hypothetical protein